MLVFPHHENVNAIAAAITGKSLARFWMHCDRILIDGRKVDENDSAYTLDDLAGMGYSGRLIRYWLFSTHYRKPITFSEDRLKYARRSLKRIDQFFSTMRNVGEGRSYEDLDQLLYDIKHGFITAMDDDLNISAALASLFSNIKKINILVLERKIAVADASRILAAFRKIDAVLGFLERGRQDDDSEVHKLIETRNQARLAQNWALADRIRDQLREQGAIVQDTKIS